jgi:ATP-dependent RNA helicase DHX36
MVILGALFKCLDPILILAGIESSRNFFLSPPGQQELSEQVRYNMSLGQPSDHLALLNGYREWRFIKSTRGRAAATEYAYQNLMHSGGLQTIEKTSEQMLQMLEEWGLATDIPVDLRYNNELGNAELNVNSDVQPLIFALLTGGLMPNLAVQFTPMLLQTSADAKALIHPGSLNSAGGRQKMNSEKLKRTRYLGAGPPGTMVVFSNKSFKAGGVFLGETSVIGPMTGLMFTGKLQPTDEPDIVNIGDWLPLKFESHVSRLVVEFTKCVDNVSPSRDY